MSAESLPGPLGSYSRFRCDGATIYLAGVSARLPDGSIDGVQHLNDASPHRDIAVQTRRVLRNIETILREAGATLADCIDMTCYLVDQQDFTVFNTTYAEFFIGEQPPTRTTVVVRGLPHPDMVVEIKAIALRRMALTLWPM
ncbi:RidA family protein [Xylophilus sp. ASV27]|uniref:RidA family protein n=1 Tax=Xylophilus sp. ASV27 TaxID=2795129 RepID=UPI0018EC4D5A